MKYALVLFLLSFIKQNEGARVLVVAPTPSLSHQIIFYPINEELVRRGHEVTFITTNPAYPQGNGPENLIEIDVGPTSYKIWKNELNLTKFGKDNFIYKGVRTVFETMTKIFEIQIKNEEVQKIIREEEFNLVILQAWVRPALIWSEIFKVPVIRVSSFPMMFDNQEAIGAPIHPFLYPECNRQKIYDSTIFDQLAELHKSYHVDSVLNSHEINEDAMLRRIFGDVPSVRDMMKNTDMLFLNVLNSMWDRNRPVPKSLVYIGNIHQKPKKELPKFNYGFICSPVKENIVRTPAWLLTEMSISCATCQDIKSFLDSSKNGVIYISFGNNVPPSKLPERVVKIFTKVFSEIPYEVIWKWDAELLPGRTKNVMASKWLPQSDIFRHPNLKLVITQGGLQTIEEAVNNGKPIIGIPFLGDQWYNIENLVHLGCGKGLEVATLTEEQFKGAILDVIGNDSYRQNVIRYHMLVEDQPWSPLERAVWWIERVLIHGSEYIHCPAATLSASDYYEIPLLCTALSCCAALTVLFISTIYYIAARLL